MPNLLDLARENPEVALAAATSLALTLGFVLGFLARPVRRDVIEVLRNGERALRGAAGLVPADTSAGISTWQAYLDQLAVSKLYPDISQPGAALWPALADLAAVLPVTRSVDIVA